MPNIRKRNWASRMDRYVVAFPGRDAFYKGLNRSFYDRYEAVREAYDRASRFIGEDLYRISYIRPDSKPELHTICLITHCYGVYQVFSKYAGPPPIGVIGFSQGEFTALAACGSLDFLSAISLTYSLEKLVFQHSRITEGKMMRIVELDTGKLEECCRLVDGEGQKVAVGIYISRDQNIISGEKESVDKVAGLAKEMGARWAINLNSMGAFHSPLCADILPEANEVFNRYFFRDARFPVYPCVDGAHTISGSRIKDKLSVQIARPVMWNKVINSIFNEKVREVIEIGAGCTVSANTRIANPEVKCRWVNELEDLEEAWKG